MTMISAVNYKKIKDFFQVHKLFILGLVIKGANGLVELAAGFLLYFLAATNVSNFIYSITSHELFEDPNDFVANILIKSADNFSISAKNFLVLFLIIHGVVKLFLVVQLFKKKIWSYPVAIFLFTLFLFYQSYRVLISFSWLMLILSIIDLFVIALIILEYRNQKNNIKL
jgi:uncharacterized membrane protein